jgi:selenoprotein W-related protein
VSQKPTISITYCAQCGFEARAAWLAQELLKSYHDQVAGVLLVPGAGGILDVAIDGEVVYSRWQTGRDPVIKELRDALHPRLPGAPERPHDL